MTKLKKLEHKALISSAVGALVMALLGFGFALLTRSEALMLDGLFSLLAFFMALGAIRISKLIHEPDSDTFQFGYAGFEPLFNVIKGLVIVFISLLALYSSVMAILAGGREINVGWALIYAIIVASCCFCMFAILTRAARNTGSSLLKVDAKNWLLDGLITVAVLIGFLVAYFSEGTPWQWAIPYADPTVVLVLIAICLPIPYVIIRDGVKELLLAAPDVELQQQLCQKLEDVLSEKDYSNNTKRVAKVGRLIYVYVFVLLQKAQADPSVNEQDTMRKALSLSVSEFYPGIEVDLFFTRDTKWFEKV